MSRSSSARCGTTQRTLLAATSARFDESDVASQQAISISYGNRAIREANAARARAANARRESDEAIEPRDSRLRNPPPREFSSRAADEPPLVVIPYRPAEPPPSSFIAYADTPLHDVAPRSLPQSSTRALPTRAAASSAPAQRTVQLIHPSLPYYENRPGPSPEDVLARRGLSAPAKPTCSALGLPGGRSVDLPTPALLVHRLRRHITLFTLHDVAPCSHPPPSTRSRRARRRRQLRRSGRCSVFIREANAARARAANARWESDEAIGETPPLREFSSRAADEPPPVVIPYRPADPPPSSFIAYADTPLHDVAPCSLPQSSTRAAASSAPAQRAVQLIHPSLPYYEARPGPSPGDMLARRGLSAPAKPTCSALGLPGGRSVDLPTSPPSSVFVPYVDTRPSSHSMTSRHVVTHRHQRAPDARGGVVSSGAADGAACLFVRPMQPVLEPQMLDGNLTRRLVRRSLALTGRALSSLAYLNALPTPAAVSSPLARRTWPLPPSGGHPLDLQTPAAKKVLTVHALLIASTYHFESFRCAPEGASATYTSAVVLHAVVRTRATAMLVRIQCPSRKRLHVSPALPYYEDRPSLSPEDIRAHWPWLVCSGEADVCSTLGLPGGHSLDLPTPALIGSPTVINARGGVVNSGEADGAARLSFSSLDRFPSGGHSSDLPTAALIGVRSHPSLPSTRAGAS
ncbi:hypothetical protein SCP_1401380 [Sparassis crispa]|uniref:Uncharacterized protein n=1 Tax=Sparassis crispa TaxID=139825 RepID=A0A401H2W1_9APHY|nr:hypothetical protein SCP_1401380 [Sparassis crispa]GBE88733.1 hypothetical protein SCP_1401380 [Sparassis crispa]